MKSCENRVAIAAEEKQRELASKVSQATWEELESRLDQDIAIIRAQMPNKATADAESALDMQYVKNRQKFLDPIQWTFQSMLRFVI